jgi:DNA-binding response OmpR family regulator
MEEGSISARVIVVHDELSFLDSLVASLRATGHDVAAFADSGLAWDALKLAAGVEILVTRVQFEPGKPHGVALARWALHNCPSVRILFVALPDFEADIEGLGLLLPRPVSVAEVAEAVGRMLSNDAIGRGQSGGGR